MLLFCIIGSMKSARIKEIFASIQGEGPWVGQRHIFVRFLGCDIRCRYCDTPATARGMSDQTGPGFCRVQISAGSLEYEQIPGVLSSHQLTELCSRLVIPGPSRSTLSLTGGEPLLHYDFLSAWLPEVRSRFNIYLETNGLRHTAMEELREMIDVVSMDFKLPSATGLRPFWDEHKRFLAAASGRPLFVKAVVTADTVRQDILTSANIIAEHHASVPFIIQPAGGPLAPEPGLLIEFQNAALGVLGDVRVIPQAHKILHVP
jgi:organic radical activating enzyme